MLGPLRRIVPEQEMFARLGRCHGREDRLYQRDVLSGFARGSRYRCPSRLRLVRPLSTRGNRPVTTRITQSPSFVPRVSTLGKKNWQVPACHSSSWFPRFVAILFSRYGKILIQKSSEAKRISRSPPSIQRIRKISLILLATLFYLPIEKETLIANRLPFPSARSSIEYFLLVYYINLQSFFSNFLNFQR